MATRRAPTTCAALRAEHPRELRIVETIPAGAFPTRAIGPGECARIFTGAPLPEGVDSVIRQEDTDAEGGRRTDPVES